MTLGKQKSKLLLFIIIDGKVMKKVFSSGKLFYLSASEFWTVLFFTTTQMKPFQWSDWRQITKEEETI